MDKVLVTGGSGFLGSHIIVQLLNAGYEVRTTLRNMHRQNEVLNMVRKGGADPKNLQFVTADLENDDEWDDAVAGCTYVLHVASPFPTGDPKDENLLIRPAVEGTLRVLRAARDGGVKRVVMTSSFAAVGYGHAPRTNPFTEADWSDPNAPDVQPYIKSKILAERAAWDFIETEGHALELAVINPTGIFGPTLGPDLSSSVEIIKSLLDGKLPSAPRVYFGMVDVRDVSDLHLRAMISPKAAGERFIAVSGELVSMLDVAKILRKNLGNAGKKAPQRELPDWVVRLLSRVLPPLRQIVPQLGIKRSTSNSKSVAILSWSPRSTDDTIIDTAQSLLGM